MLHTTQIPMHRLSHPLAQCNSRNDFQMGSQQIYEQSKHQRKISVEHDHHPTTISRPLDLVYAIVCRCPSPFTFLSLPRALTISIHPSSLCLPRPLTISFYTYQYQYYCSSSSPPSGHIPLMIVLHISQHNITCISASLSISHSCHTLSWLFHCLCF